MTSWYDFERTRPQAAAAVLFFISWVPGFAAIALALAAGSAL